MNATIRDLKEECPETMLKTLLSFHRAVPTRIPGPWHDSVTDVSIAPIFCLASKSATPEDVINDTLDASSLKMTPPERRPGDVDVDAVSKQISETFQEDDAPEREVLKLVVQCLNRWWGIAVWTMATGRATGSRAAGRAKSRAWVPVEAVKHIERSWMRREVHPSTLLDADVHKFWMTSPSHVKSVLTMWRDDILGIPKWTPAPQSFPTAFSFALNYTVEMATPPGGIRTSRPLERCQWRLVSIVTNPFTGVTRAVPRKIVLPPERPNVDDFPPERLGSSTRMNVLMCLVLTTRCSAQQAWSSGAGESGKAHEDARAHIDAQLAEALKALGVPKDKSVEWQSRRFDTSNPSWREAIQVAPKSLNGIGGGGGGSSDKREADTDMSSLSSRKDNFQDYLKRMLPPARKSKKKHRDTTTDKPKPPSTDDDAAEDPTRPSTVHPA